MLLSTSTNSGKIFSTLTRDTWGISYSLKDVSDIAYDNIASQKPTTVVTKTKGGKVDETKGAGDYLIEVKQPCRSQEFLKAFVIHLDPREAMKAKAKAGKDKGQQKASYGTGRSEGLQLMQVFGLTHAALTKTSIKSLERILELSSSSLTDLDLSFSYIGYNGANMLQKILSRKECQLVRLNVSGNAISDSGIGLISTSLKKNATLTYLDLRSNNISDSGNDVLTNYISNNRIMVTLDIRSNPITSESLYKSEKLLRDAGSQLIIRYTNKPLQEFKLNSILGPKDDDFIYQNSFLISERFNSEGDSCLYSIDVKDILARYPLGHDVDEDGQIPMVFKWTWRPVAKPLSFVKAAGITNLGWEIRTRSKEGEFVLANGAIPSNNCITDQFNKPTWCTCQATLNSLPNRGSIEIWITTDKKDKNGSKVNIYAAAEGNNFNVNFLPTNSLLVNVCGDKQDWSDSINRFSSIKGYNFNSKAINGHQVMRVLNYHDVSSKCKISWQMKIGLITGADNKMISFEEKKTAKGGSLGSLSHQHSAAIGYEWSVVKVSGFDNDKYDILSQGTCFHNDDVKANVFDTLIPWLWQDISIDIGYINTNDKILITAKPCSRLSSAANFLRECIVRVQSCNFMKTNDDTIINKKKKITINDDENNGNDINSNAKILDIESYLLSSAIHNPSNITIPM